MSTEIPGALGVASHREGKDTLALGDFSHAEGDRTQAQGQASHAEGGLTAAIGDASHTEGAYTVATGTEAHAEGHGTIAKNFAQHAEGIYNKGESDLTVSETGVGLADDDRKNGFEIYFSGEVKSPEQTIDQQKISDGKNLATIEYIDDQRVSKEIQPDGLNEVQLDFSDREVNYYVDLTVDVMLPRPLNMKRGQSGIIQFWNQTLNEIDINFDHFWFNISAIGIPTSRTETIDGQYAKMNFDYIVDDSDNISFRPGTSYVPHLKIQIGDGDYLAINANGDALLN